MPYQTIANIASPTSDAIDFTGLSLSGYTDIALQIDDLTVGTDGAALQVQFYIGGSLITSGYRYHANQTYSGALDSDSTSASAILLTRAAANGIGNATGEAFSGTFYLFNANLAYHKIIVGHATHSFTDGIARRMRSLGHLANTGTLDGLKLTLSSGTMPTCNASIVGIPNS